MPGDEPGARQLFVYWRVDPAALDAAIAVLQALHAHWRSEWPQLLAGLYLRHDADSAPTLMETYARRGADLDAGDHQRLRAAAESVSAPFRQGVRHEEWFERCAPLSR